MAKEKKVESKTSKIVNLVIMIVEILIIIAGITFSIMMLTGNKSTTDELGSGVNITAVLSDSMDGTLDSYKIKSFKIGDLLIVQNIRSDAEAQAQLKVGDVITYTGVGPDGSYGLISHRIIDIQTQKISDEDEITYFWTLGDKQYTGNEEIDMYNSKKIIGADIQGVVTGQIPKIGYAIIWFQNSTNFLVSVVVPLAILLVYNLYILIKMVVDYKIKKVKEQNALDVAAIKAENATIDEEEIKRRAIEEYLAKQAQAAAQNSVNDEIKDEKIDEPQEGGTPKEEQA